MKHYGEMYRYMNPYKTKCRTCDRKFTDATKIRICPDPDLVQKFLEQNTDFAGPINPDDRVCYTCYKSHLLITKHTHNTPSSTDPDLLTKINMIKCEMCNELDIHTIEQTLSHAAHLSAVHVGEALLKQTALLLPDVYDLFVSYVTQTASLCCIALEQDIHSIPSPNWLRKELSSPLARHVANAQSKIMAP